MSSFEKGQQGPRHAQNDHRDLNHELSYFHLDEDIGAGLPLWLPAGVVVRDELEKLMKEFEFLDGYQRVVSPHIAKEDLYLKSGHLPYYAEDMYPAMDLDSVKYRLRPMCCPHHHKIYSSKLRSYRELPIRLAEYGQVYRYEGSGALSGLMRVRGMCQNDAHIYVSKSQVKKEIMKVLELYKKAYGILGISNYKVRLSRADHSEAGKSKYVSQLENWEWAEGVLREILNDLGWEYEEAVGEAAFYGPKIDIQMVSVLGKEDSASTVQLDFMSAERFDLSFINEQGDRERPVIIHRAPLGAHERTVAFLLEHYQGALPLWLSPEQVVILPIADRHVEFAEKIRAELHKSFVRVRVDDRAESLRRKLAEAWQQKAYYVLVIGDHEVESNMLKIQKRAEPNSENMYLNEFLAKIQKEILQRLLP